jgi:hypothetical protein
LAKYQEWLLEENLKNLKEWSQNGLTDIQIANNMGIGVSTLYEWKNKYSEFSEALKNGKEIADLQVVNSLYKKTQGYNAQIRKNFKLKEVKYNNDGKKISEKETLVIGIDEVHIPPDTMAIIYWLNNRMPSEWKNKQEIVTTNFENFETLAEKLKIKESE